MKMNFDEILDKYRGAAHHKADLGTRFEELMARFLMTDPMYSPRLEKVWTWNTFPFKKDISDHDTGIDLVAQTKTGDYWAVQCKFYAEDYRVSKEDLDTFISTSGKRFKDDSGEYKTFSNRLLIATTDNWTETAITSTENQIIPVTRVGLKILREAPVDWTAIYEGVHGKKARTSKYTLRPHQQEAFNNAIKHYKNNNKGQMIMACGTGKTFTSLKIAEELSAGGNRCVLFLAPSIALISQTLREWTAHSKDDLNIIAVCSDPKVTKKKTIDDLGEHVEDLGAPATTDSQEILKLYKNGEGMTTIFSTYQSIDSVIDAQKAGLPEFDVIICDEAHRTTGTIIDGQDEKHFTKVHSDDNIRGKKRLYMTATPRIYGVKGKETAEKEAITLCSMNDPETYGIEFYNIGFGEAVERELLSDYKVLILTIKDSDIPDAVKRRMKKQELGKEIDTETASKAWGCMNALAKNLAYDETVKHTDPEKMKSAVAFTRTIASSKDITDIFNTLSEFPDAAVDLEMKHIDGSMNAFKRDNLLNWLKGGSPDCRILSNVRCLSEGVDVPALDAIMFLSNKNSLIDIVQSVGRVMRKSSGKKYGYIIIPVISPEGVDADVALDNDDQYKVVWQVLRALRSHDERMEAEVNTIQYTNKSGKILTARLKTARRDGIGDDSDVGREPRQYLLDDFETKLLARLVLKVGDRNYIENWAKDVAKVMPDLLERLNLICKAEEYGNKQYKPAFTRYLKGLRASVNDNVSEEDAINMLAQQIITKPIFERLFGDDGFVTRNSVSRSIDAMLAEIDAKDGLKDVNEKLSNFHLSVERTLENIDTVEGKQKVITSLYEKFFKNAFPKDQSINGVVYTPQEIVDFMIRSASDVLKQEFGLNLSDEGVNILDPFTGTGTFIARLIESGIISKEDLERKYRHELFANEITLLAYYIAAVNIENAFARITGSEEYVPFENILLTDTFNIEQICEETTVQTDLTGGEYFKRNKERIRRENDTPITIIMANPPYGARGRTANEDAAKRTYIGGVDAEIERKYLDEKLFDDRIGNVNSVYDNYIRAFRWSTDRIGNDDGIIAFVTPNGWLTTSAFVGFRKCIEKEFSKIYIFDLRGDQNGQNWREEGEKVFGSGSKIGISITLLVKHKNFKDKAEVHYFSTEDYMKRPEKFNLLTQNKSFSIMGGKGLLKILNIKENGDWIIERNEFFQKLIPLAGNTSKKFESHEEDTIFVGYSLGYATGRDMWSYNFSKEKISNNMQIMIEEYNLQIKNGNQEFNLKKISWNRSLESYFKRGDIGLFDKKQIRSSLYRPFSKRWFYSDSMFISMVYRNEMFFPTLDTENLLICVSGIGNKRDFSCLITDKMTDLNLVGSSQCFPLYWYEDKGKLRAKNKQQSLIEEQEDLVKHDGISDYALKIAKKKYGNSLTKEDIFFYLYGYLHSPEYRDAFSSDLIFSLPRIHFVDDIKDFNSFLQAGKDLANLHLNYENVDAPKTLEFSNEIKIENLLNEPDMCNITKMRLYPKERKLFYNHNLTIKNIPNEALEYMISGRSALGWIVDQYKYSKDKKSGIVNDPNDYGGGEYILKLVLSIIGVSVETTKIVKKLPSLGLSSDKVNITN